MRVAKSYTNNCFCFKCNAAQTWNIWIPSLACVVLSTLCSQLRTCICDGCRLIIHSGSCQLECVIFIVVANVCVRHMCCAPFLFAPIQEFFISSPDSVRLWIRSVHSPCGYFISANQWIQTVFYSLYYLSFQSLVFFIIQYQFWLRIHE